MKGLIYIYIMFTSRASQLRGRGLLPCHVPDPATATSLVPATPLILPPQRPWPLQRPWYLLNVTNPAPERSWCLFNVANPAPERSWCLFNVTNPAPERSCHLFNVTNHAPERSWYLTNVTNHAPLQVATIRSRKTLQVRPRNQSESRYCLRSDTIEEDLAGETS